MTINPIIPLWLMGIICIVLLFFKRKGVFNYIRQIVIVLLIFVINMRIMILSDDISNMTSNIDVIFVVDNTISMLAEDYDGDGIRLDAAKEDCKYIIEEFAGASFGLVVFDNEVYKKVPYTIDSSMVEQAIDVLFGQTLYYAKGTSLNDVMSKMDEMLQSNRDTYKLVFFLSDGEIINGDELSSHKELSKHVDSGAVIGYGTEKGGVMHPLPYAGSESTELLTYYNEDFDEVKGISKIDEGNLKRIAKDFGVDYVRATDHKTVKKQVEAIKKDLGKNMDFESGDGTQGYQETYFYFVIALVAVLVYDLVYYKNKA